MLLLFIIILSSSFVYAQDYKAVVHKKNGSIRAFYVSDIDSITFIDSELPDTCFDSFIVVHDTLVINNKVYTSFDSTTVIELNQKNLNYDAIVRSINRIADCLPEPLQTIPAYIHAYNIGYRILLCDLVFTADNIPVLSHDSYLNQYYNNVRTSEGTQIADPNNPENRVYFSKTNYSDLYNNYDFGVYKGDTYKGIHVPTFESMVNLCRSLGCELYVEVKEMTEMQAAIATSIVQRYEMSEKTSWSGSLAQMKAVIREIPSARVSLMPPRNFSVKDIDNAISLKTGKNKVFLFGWDSGLLTDDLVEYMQKNDISFEMGTLNTASDIIEYYNRGYAYKYCTGIETQTVLAGKVILEDVLAQASDINKLKGSLLENIYYDDNDGYSEISWNTWALFDGFISIDSNESYELVSFRDGKKGNVQNFLAYFYDSKEKFIEAKYFGGVHKLFFSELKIPQNARFIRFSGSILDFPTLVFGLKSEIDNITFYVRPYGLTENVYVTNN